MKISVEIIVETDTGEYDVKFKNVSNPGEPMDYNLINKFVKSIMSDVENQVDSTGIESNDKVFKFIN